MGGCCCCWRRLAAVHESLDPPLEVTPGQEDAATTSQATHADVSAQPYDRPLEAAAGVWLAQAYNITQTDFQRHTASLR